MLNEKYLLFIANKIFETPYDSSMAYSCQLILHVDERFESFNISDNLVEISVQFLCFEKGMEKGTIY